MERFLAAAVQMTSGEDKEENVKLAEELLDEAAKRQARLVVLPEVFNFIGSAKDEPEQAETIPGPTTEKMAAKAREHGYWLVAGSILEKVEGKKKIYNTTTIFSPEGKLTARYRKLHLFDVDVEGGPRVMESAFREGGGEVVTTETELCVLGLSICYDLRFPEIYREMVFRGAELITVASDFTLLTGKDHWESLLRARAIENQVYLIAPNQVGQKKNFAAYGHSMIVDPWGKVLTQARDEACVITAEIDLDYQKKVRRQLPSLQHLSPVLNHRNN